MRALHVNPVLLAVTLATFAGIGWMLLVERRAAKPRPPYPTADDWHWDEWDGDE